MSHLSNTKPLLCRELVGREHELQALHEALQHAATGKPQFVLLAGEAGLGKTKLCHAFMQTSQTEQAVVLFGQAIPQDASLPFGPLLDAFRRYFTITSKVPSSSDESLRTALAFLFRLLPELAVLFPEVTPALETKGAVVQSQQAVFHGLLSILQVLARSSPGPLLLILEDLHWADETSLEWLAFLAQRLDVNSIPVPSMHTEKSTALMILGTYRIEVLSDTPALKRFLVQLHMQRRDHEVRLAPLSFADHRRCLSNILEQPVLEAFAASLLDWDEGNPFFMEELLGAMAVSGQLHLIQNTWHIAPDSRPTLPSSIATAILERFVRLPAVDQEILSYAAVIGRVFDFPLLATLCALDERELVDVLRRAMNVQLINEVSNTQPYGAANREQERYQFRHALIREALYEQMLAPERRLRHRMVAETIEKLSNEVSTAGGNSTALIQQDNVDRLLAEHYWLAGLSEKARPHALHEAERASRVFAFREERHYLNMAQASLPEDSSERLQLLHRLGLVSMVIYDFSAALNSLSLARTGYQRAGQPYQALQVLANMLLPTWFVGGSSLPDMLTELETAAEAVFADFDSGNKDSSILVITSLIAIYQTFEGLFRRATRWIERGASLYESLDDPRKVAAMQLSFLARAWIKANQSTSIAEEGIVEARNVLEVGFQHSLPDVILFSYASLALILINRGRSGEADQVLEEGIDFEMRSGIPRPAFVIGWQLFFSGERWDQTIASLREDMKRMEQAGVLAILASEGIALAHLLLARNELDEAQRHFQRIQPILESLDQYIYITQLWWGLARLCAARGDLSQAQQWYERILSRWKTSEDTLLIFPMLLDGIVFYADTGDLKKARQWLDELRAVMRITDNPVGAAALLQAEGVVWAAAGKVEDAILWLRQAVEAWRNLKRRYQYALASQRLAEVLLTRASKGSTPRFTVQATREEAEILLNKALIVYEDLQLPTGRQAIHALRSRTHLEAQRKRRQTIEMHQPLQRLTQRERQVLLQLTAGHTNRAIAGALHISVGTVELHVNHILNKLGCQTRTQAAAYAIAQGWVNKLSN